MSNPISVFEYTKLLTSVNESLPSEINFVPCEYCCTLLDNLNRNYQRVASKGTYNSIISQHNELFNILKEQSKEIKELYASDPDFFTVGPEYRQVIMKFLDAVKGMPRDYETNKIFFKAVNGLLDGYKSPVDYISRLVIRRMSFLNEELLGDFADNWNENATSEEKSRIISLLIMRQFIHCFRDGSLFIPVRSGGGFAIGCELKFIRLSDKGKYSPWDFKKLVEKNDFWSDEIKAICDKEYGGDFSRMESEISKKEKITEKKDEFRKKVTRIATADDFWSPEITKLCNESYGGSFENMARTLSFEDFDKLYNAKGCRLAKLAHQFARVDFGSQKKGRANMYIFAIAFELTYNNSLARDTDISKCLFYDLYNNSFLTGEEETENSVAGYGINYRNFVDIIYLYYMGKERDVTGANLTPALRLYRALNTIAYVKKEQEKIKKDDPAVIEELEKYAVKGASEMLTEEFADSVVIPMMAFEEDEFRARLISNIVCSFEDPFLSCENFPLSKGFTSDEAEKYVSGVAVRSFKTKDGKEKTVAVLTLEQKRAICNRECRGKCYGEHEGKPCENWCSIYCGRGWQGKHQLSLEQKTAKKFYELFNESDISRELIEFKFVPLNTTGKYPPGSIVYNPQKADSPKVKRLMEAVNKIRLAITDDYFRPDSDDPEKEYVISRNALLGAYCRYVAGEAEEASGDEIQRAALRRKLKSFDDFYKYFCAELPIRADKMKLSGINEVLIKANFQPISHSSLVDLVAVYMTYRTCLAALYDN